MLETFFDSGTVLGGESPATPKEQEELENLLDELSTCAPYCGRTVALIAIVVHTTISMPVKPSRKVDGM